MLRLYFHICKGFLGKVAGKVSNPHILYYKGNDLWNVTEC